MKPLDDVTDEEQESLLHDKNERQTLLRTAPHDNYHLAYVLFYLQGVGMLFPFNVFITATSFFKLKFVGSIFVDNFNR